MAAADELFRQMGTDESRAAGDEIGSHSVEVVQEPSVPSGRIVARSTRPDQFVNPACGRPGVSLSAFP